MRGSEYEQRRPGTRQRSHTASSGNALDFAEADATGNRNCLKVLADNMLLRWLLCVDDLV